MTDLQRPTDAPASRLRVVGELALGAGIGFLLGPWVPLLAFSAGFAGMLLIPTAIVASVVAMVAIHPAEVSSKIRVCGAAMAVAWLVLAGWLPALGS
ncbi:MAG TPA: hypothetical protein VGE43_10200 [Acidimicrobiales bacterium]